MATLSELRTRVREHLIDVPTRTANQLDNWINEALVALQDRHNFRWMEAEQSYATTPNERTLSATKPSDWKEARTFPWLHDGLGGAQPIDWAASQGQMRQLFSEDDTDRDTGPPRFVRELDDGLEVYPFPDDNSLWNDGNYRVVVPYWGYLPALSADDDSNVVTNDLVGEHYLVFSAVGEGFLFNLAEERGNFWLGRAGIKARLLIRRDKQSYLHRKVTLAPRPGVYSARIGRHGRSRA